MPGFVLILKKEKLNFHNILLYLTQLLEKIGTIFKIGALKDQTINKIGLF